MAKSAGLAMGLIFQGLALVLGGSVTIGATISSYYKDRKQQLHRIYMIFFFFFY